MLRLCFVCLALILSTPALGMEPAAELDYAIDQPLLTIRDAEVRYEDDEVATLCAGCLVHIDWDDGDRLLTTRNGERVTMSRADLRPIRQAVDCFTEQLKANPKCPVLYLCRSHAYWLSGRLEDAAADAESARKLDGLNSVTEVMRGILCGNIGDLGGAWCEAELIRMLDPFNSDGYLLSAAIALEMRDHEACKFYLTAALELDPDNADIQRHLATALGYSAKTPEEWEVVLGILNEVVRLNPYDAHAFECRRQVHRKLGHPVEAHDDLMSCRRLYTQWQKGCPENPEYWISRGRLYFELKSWTEALDDFSEAVRLDPDNIRAREILCMILKEKKEYKKASAELARILEIQPRNLSARIERMSLAYNSGQSREAVADAEAILKYFPENRNARLLRALVAAQNRDWQSAEADYRFLIADRTSHRIVSQEEAREKITNEELAQVCLVMGDEARALTLLEGAHPKSMASLNCFRMLARWALIRRDWTAARAMLAKGDLEDQETRMLMAICCYQSGDFDRAYRELDEVVTAGTTYDTPAVEAPLLTLKFGDTGLSILDDAAAKSSVDGETQDSVATPVQSERQFNKTAQEAKLFRDLFRIEQCQIEPDSDFIKEIKSPGTLLKGYYAHIRIYALDQNRQFRDGEEAVENGQQFLKLRVMPEVLRIPLYEAIAAGNAETGNFDEAVRWQRRILDETPRDHPRRKWYWDIHQLYLRLEIYPEGLTDPDLVLPVIHAYLNLEGAPGILSPLPPPLPE